MFSTIQILCLHLKRFRWTRFFRAKVDTFVKFPLENLDISPFCSGDGSSIIYELYAAIVHLGSGPSSGHYVAYAKGTSGEWYIFNDVHITATSAEDMARQHVYILFYRKKKEESIREKLRSYAKQKQQQ
jgi:ubiquitin carboxyl-terminal hydrolase 3